jgi:hypothetical protein
VPEGTVYGLPQSKAGALGPRLRGDDEELAAGNGSRAAVQPCIPDGWPREGAPTTANGLA